MSSTIHWATLTPQQKERVMTEAVEELSARFAWYTDGLLEALGLRDLKGEELLKFYRERAPEAWEALRQAFPQDHDEQMREMGRLEARDLLKKPEMPTIGSPLGQLEVPIERTPTEPTQASAILSPFRIGGTV